LKKAASSNLASSIVCDYGYVVPLEDRQNRRTGEPFFFKRGRVSQIEGEQRLRVFVFAESARNNRFIHLLHNLKLLSPRLLLLQAI
jgi:hypothetical protein